MEKLSPKTAQTKADLVTAFWQLYKEKPINKITVKDVTDTAGYYRSTLYYYFEDVYDILDYIEESVIREWDENLLSVLIDHKAVLMLHDLRAVIDMIMPFYYKNGEYIAVLSSQNGDPLFVPKFKAALRKRIFATLEIPEGTTEAELLFEGVSSGILAVFVKWYADKLPTELVVDVAQKILDKNIWRIMFSYSGNPMLKQFSQST